MRRRAAQTDRQRLGGVFTRAGRPNETSLASSAEWILRIKPVYIRTTHDRLSRLDVSTCTRSGRGGSCLVRVTTSARSGVPLEEAVKQGQHHISKRLTEVNTVIRRRRASASSAPRGTWDTRAGRHRTRCTRTCDQLTTRHEGVARRLVEADNALFGRRDLGCRRGRRWTLSEFALTTGKLDVHVTSSAAAGMVAPARSRLEDKALWPCVAAKERPTASPKVFFRRVWVSFGPSLHPPVSRDRHPGLAQRKRDAR